jgi:beta-aspartyl-peptidase (threonine type)
MSGVILANNEGGIAVEIAIDAVRGGRSALDAVEAAIRVVERDPSVHSVGFSGAPNALGQVECAASIMCGATLRAGAVGALRDCLHAISVARQIMERTPHVMLVGEGAARFAAEIGEEKADLLSSEARAEYEDWVREHVPADLLGDWPEVPLSRVLWPSSDSGARKGTTCYLVRAGDGNWAGGISTSGWAYKHPGRLGDSPIIGAGLYVDNRYGAVACTHIGEMTIRAGTARAAVASLERGASAAEACRKALDELRSLKGGYLGPVTVHVMDREGDPFVASIGLEEPEPFWFWREGMESAERRETVPL